MSQFSDFDSSIRSSFIEINKCIDENPLNYEIVMTELNAIINKIDPLISSGNVQPLSLVNPHFKQDTRAIRTRINEIVGHKIKIPDLRFHADKFSVELGIPLPNSTRKNNEALLQWFQIHWVQLEPKLREIPQQAHF